MRDSVIETDIGSYTFNSKYCVGQGSFGKVYKGVHKQTKQPVAIKQLDSGLISEVEVGHEIGILKQLVHANIVKYEDALQLHGCFYIVMEYCAGGDLKAKFQDSDGEDSDEGATGNSSQHRQRQILDMFFQLCEGFCYLEKARVIHRDLKPTNILLHHGQYKIVDFGMARRESVHKSAIQKDLLGVPAYMSPQILSKNYYTGKCDVWSLGVIVYQLLLGELPWKSADADTLFFKTLDEPYHYGERANLSHPLFKVIFSHTLRYLEKDRLSWSELRELKNATLPKQPDLIKKNSSQPATSYYSQNLNIREVEILRHMLGLISSLSTELPQLTSDQSIQTVVSTIAKYLVEGPQCSGTCEAIHAELLYDCLKVFLRMAGGNLHLQMLEYACLEDARELLVLLELVHDYLRSKQSSPGTSMQLGLLFDSSQRSAKIEYYAAEVISKVNTLLFA